MAEDGNLLVVCELQKNTISRNVIEVVINDLEMCIEFLLQNVDTRNDVTEISINLHVIYCDWCRKLSERNLEKGGRTGTKRSNWFLYSLWWRTWSNCPIIFFVHGCHFGFSGVYGHISSLGIKAQRDRVRACLRKVYPQNSRLRWANIITRRTYSVLF